MPYVNQKADCIGQKKTENSALLYFPAFLMLLNNLFFNADNFVPKAVLAFSLVLAIACNVKQGVVSKTCMIALAGIALALLNTFINGSGIGSFITYANLLLFTVFYSQADVTERQRRNLHTILIVSLLLIVMIFSDYNAVNTYYYSRIPALGAQRLNPNMMGIVCFFLYFFLFLKCKAFRSRRACIAVCALLFVLFFFLIYMSKARTTLAAFLLFNVMLFSKSLVPRFLKKKRLFLFCLIFSIIFTLFYLYLFKLIGSRTIFNKDLFSGRQVVWQEAWDIIRNNWLFGYSNKFLFFGGKLTSAHNSLLSILFIFGLFPTLVAIATMCRAYKNTLRVTRDFTTIKMLYCCIFIMFFETLLSDSNSYYYFTILFLKEAKAVDT